jgi:hypothetical protein
MSKETLMRKLLLFLGGAALGYAAPKIVTLIRDLCQENISDDSEDDIAGEVETASAAPDAVKLPITDEEAAPAPEATPPDPQGSQA